MRCLVTSDWHLDAVTAGVERYADVAEAAASTVSAAVAQNVGLFVFLGDLSDPNSRSHRAVAFAASVVMRFAAEGVHSVWVGGNHDVIEDGHGTTTLAALAEAFPDVASVITRPIHGELLGGVPFIGLPYTARAVDYDPEAFAEEAVAAVMRTRNQWMTPPLVLGHLWIPGAVDGGESEMPRGRELVWPMSLGSAFAAQSVEPLLLNGHYHAGGRIHDILIPGSVQRLSFGEEGNAPGYLLAESRDAADPWKVERVELPATRRLVTVESAMKVWKAKRLPNKASLRKLVDGEAIVRLRPPAGGGERAEVLKAALLDAGALSVKVLPPEPGSTVVVGKAVAKAARRTNRALVLDLVDEANTDDRDALRAVVESAMDAEGI